MTKSLENKRKVQSFILTKRERELLVYILAVGKDKWTFKGAMNFLGVRSPTTIQQIIRQLYRKGIDVYKRKKNKPAIKPEVEIKAYNTKLD